MKLLRKRYVVKVESFQKLSTAFALHITPQVFSAAGLLTINTVPKKKGENVEVQGSYDINVWFSYNDNTKTEVATSTATYTDIIPLSVRDDHVLSDNMEVIAKPIQQPNTLEATISEEGSSVDVQVEREFVVDCIGETKIAVTVNPDGLIDDYPVVEYDDQVSDEEYEQLDPNFLHGEVEN